MHKTSALVALAASLSTAASASVGTAYVQNFCNFDVYYQAVCDDFNAPIEVLKAGSGVAGQYSEKFRTKKDGGGVSIKIGMSREAVASGTYQGANNEMLKGLWVNGDITQFEYTLNLTESKTYYDISNVNGYALKGVKTDIVPSDSSCTTVECEPAFEKGFCPGAYTLFNDDWATHACGHTADLVFKMCADGSSSLPSSSSQAPSSSSTTSTPTPTSTSSSTTSTSSSTTSEKPSITPDTGLSFKEANNDPANDPGVHVEVVWETVFITETATALSARSTPEAGKRDIHEHAHHHAHHRARRNRIGRHH